jgi:hypothetical protein
MRKLFGFVVLLITAVVLLFSASGTGNPGVAPGFVEAIRPGTAIHVVRSARNGAIGTELWNLNNLWTFLQVIPNCKCVAFVTVDVNNFDVFGKLHQYGGNLVSATTMKGFTEGLRAAGWVQKTTKEVPQVIDTGLKCGAIAANMVPAPAGWLARIASVRPTFVLMFEGSTTLYRDIVIPTYGDG